jgi:hypothetical protein
LKASEFKHVLEEAFQRAGFRKFANCLSYVGNDVTVLVSLQKVEYSGQIFVNVGFWLHQLSDSVPNKVEKTHMYFRLENLHPGYRDVILAAGDLGAADQKHGLQKLLDVLGSEIVPNIVHLADQSAILAAFKNARFQRGFIRKDAKEFLAKQ